MTLNEALLQKLAKWRATNRQAFEVTEGGWAAWVTADRADDLGCLVWELDVRKVPAGTVALAAWAERVTKQATGLLENLTLLEVDQDKQTALLRSDEPARRDDDVFYYEMLLHGRGAATLRRYRGSRQGSRREQVGFALTHEALAKMAGVIAKE